MRLQVRTDCGRAPASYRQTQGLWRQGRQGSGTPIVSLEELMDCVLSKPHLVVVTCVPLPQHMKHPWVPLFRLQLKRPEGVGELSLCRVAMAFGASESLGRVLTGGPEERGRLKLFVGSASGFGEKVPENETLKSKLYLATEEGDLLAADWRARQNAAAGTLEALCPRERGLTLSSSHWLDGRRLLGTPY
jgi:hypothetical protein